MSTTTTQTNTEIQESFGKKKMLSILIPAYNEARTLAAILDSVIRVDLIRNLQKEIIIIDDCSTDMTAQVAEAFVRLHPNDNIRLISHEVNQGKGAAVHSGIREATGEFLIIQDADVETDPEEYNRLLLPMLNERADVVYGSRYVGGLPHRKLFFLHSFGNKFLTFVSNLFTNLNLTDMETCYKLFRSEIIQGIVLKEKRFGFEPEVTAKISKIPGIRIYEVGISYYGRTRADGKKIGWKDAIRTFYCILKYNWFPGEFNPKKLQVKQL